ncbi:MAG: formate/nitrite transporter family protein [Acetatifactor sp.]|nr:formate/nitrite transporter family protein [Acetatifactor sp.]
MYTPSEIAKRYSEAGAAKTRISIMKTFTLAVFAGIFIAFGAYGSQVAAFNAGSESFGKFLSALVFPVGLLMVIMAGAELFTGNSLIIISVLNKKTTIKRLFRNWGIVYLGNFAGSVLVAFLLTYSHAYSVFDGRLAQVVVTTAQNKVLLSFQDAFLRGILCNILVCLSVWVSFAAEDVAGKILGLYLPIMLFVVSGYEHCVANMYFIPAGMLVSAEYGISADSLTWSGFLTNNLLPVTLGNILGGACIVGAGYFYIYLHHTESSKA